MSELASDKYQGKVASLDRLNAYTIARRELIRRAFRLRFTTSATLKSAKSVLDVGCGNATLRGLVARRTKAEIASTRHMRKLSSNESRCW